MASQTKTVRSRRTRAALVAALQERLASEGVFTASEIAVDVGCTTGTFWAHFDDKDDAIAEAFSATLQELVELTAELFGEGPSGLLSCETQRDRREWAHRTIDKLVEFFGRTQLVFRTALARLPESRQVRKAFRTAEQETITLARSAIAGPDAQADATAVIAYCQGINNPIVLRTKPDSRVRERLAAGLNALLL